MRYLILIAIAVIVFLSGCNPKVTVTDTQGRIFEKVREAKTNSNGVIDIELWQIKGKTGHEYPVYIKLLTEQPTFTLAQ